MTFTVHFSKILVKTTDCWLIFSVLQLQEQFWNKLYEKVRIWPNSTRKK